MSFAQRLIDVTVQLAPSTGTNQPNTFDESGTDTVTLSGLRTSVRIENSGSPANSNAQIKIWGLTQSLMNQMTTLGLVFNLVAKNQITIAAGDPASGMATVFTGTIWSAYADYTAQPDVPFVFECLQAGADAVIGAPPSSFPGSADVATMMSGFARQMNVGFENNGITAKLTNAHYSGAAKVQAARCAAEAHIAWGFVNGGSVLAIWPLGGNRNTTSVPTISASTGMIGYPAFTQTGIIVKTLFNPLIALGGLIKVESSLLSAIGQIQAQKTQVPLANTFPSQWAVNKLDLALDSLLPKGQWMSVIYAYNPGFPRPFIQNG